jgi:mannose-6-phosphate isomerase-like protein (cupin superfamily)
MVNWAKLPSGNRFARHYHEDMQEIFIILLGEVEVTVGRETVVLGRGDSILIEPHEIHQMWNPGPQEIEYLAIGISRGTGGRTAVV